MAKEIASGVIGGIIGAGLMKITAPPSITITSSKEVLARSPVSAGLTVTVKLNTGYKFAIILFHGDGDPQIEVRIEGETVRTIRGHEQGIELIANETITIRAVNTDPNNNRNKPTIEILSLDWS